jgi:hypothetical protein
MSGTWLKEDRSFGHKFSIPPNMLCYEGLEPTSEHRAVGDPFALFKEFLPDPSDNRNEEIGKFVIHILALITIPGKLAAHPPRGLNPSAEFSG